MGFGNFNIFNKAPQEASTGERDPSAQELHVFNTIQRQLMLHYEKEHGVSSGDVEAHRQSNSEWIEKYAPGFGDLRKELIKNNSHLVEDWLEHPDEVSRNIEREVKIRLYHDDPLSGGTEQAA